MITQRFIKAVAERMFLGRSETAWSSFELGLGAADVSTLNALSVLADVQEIASEDYARVSVTWDASTEEALAGLFFSGTYGWTNNSGDDWAEVKNVFAVGTIAGEAEQLCIVVEVDPARTLADGDSLIIPDGYLSFRLDMRTAGANGQ